MQPPTSRPVQREWMIPTTTENTDAAPASSGADHQTSHWIISPAGPLAHLGEQPGREQAGGVGTVLGNGSGNETLRDQVHRLRRSWTMQVPAVVLTARMHPAETSETTLALLITQRS